MNCFYCNMSVHAAACYILPKPVSLEEHARKHWVTYNPELDTFCCNDCLEELDVRAQMVFDGWRAGQPLREQHAGIPYNAGIDTRNWRRTKIEWPEEQSD